jgi:hypothetical protein
MRTLLKTCANLKRGHAELQAVKDDPDGLVELWSASGPRMARMTSVQRRSWRCVATARVTAS